MLGQYSEISEVLVHTAHIVNPKKGSMVCNYILLQILGKSAVRRYYTVSLDGFGQQGEFEQILISS